ncbi:hypothetical protein SAMN05428949_3018 [Chitinophaga sp. YR627]|uniref:hypothetical protein n=1 Tax=Chitinophaga sp. YR627 TaxID=1881041 RepID=UPI0008EB9163|nr:hypothetical protein [Chitinophaga sp. YR627]SFN49107.1 hypothetical protein SAMN05428949_3018 [Chitinophaga sp. YR627]
MKSTQIFKTILLALPFLILLYVFFLRDRIDTGDGIGGGSYDLTKPYTAIGIGLYALILSLVLLIQDAHGNRVFLLTGIILLIVTIIMGVRSF